MSKNITRPNKLLGQNWLRDKKVLDKIIAAANLTAGDSALEVGPGLGVLTRELAKHAGRVIAVEKDKTLAETLKKQLIEENIGNVEIIKEDILSFLSRICHSREGGNPVRDKLQQESRPWIPGQARDDNALLFTPYKVIANIPYYLTSHLIRLLLESDNPPTDIILMIQKEVAKRICAKPPAMSLLAVSVQFYADAKIIASVSKNSFWPKPKVDSAIIRITPRAICPPSKGGAGEVKKEYVQTQDLNPPTPLCARGDKTEIHQFFRVLHAGFAHPRKQLLNNLSAGLNIPRDKIADILQKAGLAPEQRAETLSIADWIKLADLI